jgi:hypothetical protein
VFRVRVPAGPALHHGFHHATRTPMRIGLASHARQPFHAVHGTLKVPCQIPFLLSLLAAVNTCPEVPKAVMTKFGSDGGNFLAVRIAPVDSLSPKRLEIGPLARHATTN